MQEKDRIVGVLPAFDPGYGTDGYFVAITRPRHHPDRPDLVIARQVIGWAVASDGRVFPVAEMGAERPRVFDESPGQAFACDGPARFVGVYLGPHDSVTDMVGEMLWEGSIDSVPCPCGSCTAHVGPS